MPEHFHVFIKEERFEASYEISGPMLTVRSAYGSKRAPVGLMKPDKLARALFRVILRNVPTLAAPPRVTAANPAEAARAH